MTLARPLLLVLLLAGVTVSATAADGSRQQSSSTSVQINANYSASAPDTLQEGSGFLLSSGEPHNFARRSLPGERIARLDEGLCYTMRTYKVERTEHLADSQTGMRGYSTCQMAKNYEFRSAVAHPRPADSVQDPRK